PRSCMRAALLDGQALTAHTPLRLSALPAAQSTSPDRDPDRSRLDCSQPDGLVGKRLTDSPCRSVPRNSTALHQTAPPQPRRAALPVFQSTHEYTHPAHNSSPSRSMKLVA